MVNFNPIDKDYIVRWQSDIENTKRPFHKPSQDQRKSTALGGAWNFAERCIVFCPKIEEKYTSERIKIIYGRCHFLVRVGLKETHLLFLGLTVIHIVRFGKYEYPYILLLNHCISREWNFAVWPHWTCPLTLEFVDFKLYTSRITKVNNYFVGDL